MTKRAPRGVSTSCCLVATRVSVCLVPVQDPFDSSTRPVCIASRILRLLRLRKQRFCTRSTFFSWRCRAGPPSSNFLHAAINIRPPSVADSTHTPASNAVAFQPSAMPNARTSLCAQLIRMHLPLPSPSFPHCTLKVFEERDLPLATACRSFGLLASARTKIILAERLSALWVPPYHTLLFCVSVLVCSLFFFSTFFGLLMLRTCEIKLVHTYR